MTKNNFLIEAILSLNKGNSGYSIDRLKVAEQQLKQLIEKGVVFEKE